MYEFHGWVTIRESSKIISENNIYEIVNQIKTYIDNINWNCGTLDLRSVNGQFHLLVSGFTNRKGKDAEEVLNVYKYISKIAPGSYGLLYNRDDEDINGKDNIFRVLVLTRGNIKEYEDSFLSPFIPIVEDEFEE